MRTFRVVAVHLGCPRPFGPQGQLSAIDKTPVSGPVLAMATGFAGDAQADRRHHGGPDKAIHAYAAAHYSAWIAEMPAAATRFRPGGFGENLVVAGATETDICLGDRWRVGAASLEVAQGRQPCWKLNLRFGMPDMARRVQASGRTGWYFRVTAPGEIAAGDTGRLETRPHSDWPLDRVSRLLYRDTLDRAALESLAALPGLPESWRRLALRRLDSSQVEDWRPRVETPS